MIKGKFNHNPRHIVMLRKQFNTKVDGGNIISIKQKNPNNIYTEVRQPETIGKPNPAPVNAIIAGNGLDMIKFPQQLKKKKKITLSLN